MPKLIVPSTKPRNPLVAAARLRQAGRHGAGQRTSRREGQQALQRELATLAPTHDVHSKPPSL